MNEHRDGRHDFDFFHGRWNIRNRRLARRFEGSTEWQEFDATGICDPILGGVGNIDSFHATLPDGQPIIGMSLRIFNPETREWSIYWADNRACRLFPPVLGGFKNGVGAFRGEDTSDGLPVQVIFRWFDVTPDSATWEQAFSADDGQTWETNWHMFFTRQP